MVMCLLSTALYGYAGHGGRRSVHCDRRQDNSADPFYFSPKYTQFLYDQDVFAVPVCFGTSDKQVFPEGGVRTFRSQTPVIQPEVCDLSGTGSGPSISRTPWASQCQNTGG